MPKFVEVSDEDINSVEDQGGLSKKTRLERSRVVGYLRNFLVDNVEGAPDLETLIKEAASGNTEPLEHHIEKFFTGYRVTDKKTGQLLLPKKGTKDCYMSHLKMHILGETKGVVNIECKSTFKKLALFSSGYVVRLKQAGRADTTHTEALSAETQRAIFTLFGYLTKVIEARETVSYAEALEKIPEEFRDKYHELLLMAAVFTLLMFDVRRGREGLAELSKDTYKRVTFNKMDYYEKTRGELSKNHSRDSEDLADAGVIPFFEDEFGYNPGVIIDLYLATTNDKCPRLFQRAKRPSKKFDLHSYKSTVWYENAPCGRHKIGEMVKDICRIAGVEQQPNHSIRATGIRALKRDGFDVHDVCRLSGHKNPSNLRHYHAPTTTDKLRMSMALQHAHKTLDTGCPQDLNQLIDKSKDGPLPGTSHEVTDVFSPEEFLEDNNEPFPKDIEEPNAEPSNQGSPIRKKPRFEDKENVPPGDISGEGPMALSTQTPLATIWKPSTLAQSGSSNSIIPAGLTELVYNQQLIEAQRNRQIVEAMRMSTSGDLVKQLMELASKK